MRLLRQDQGGCRTNFHGGGGTETRANQSGVRALSSRLERGQRRIALETLSECGPTLGTEGVLEQTADGLTLTGEGGASKSACTALILADGFFQKRELPKVPKNEYVCTRAFRGSALAARPRSLQDVGAL